MSEVQGVSAGRKRKRFGLWGLVLLALVAGGTWLVIDQPWVEKPAVVLVEVVSEAPASRVLAVNGRATPAQQVEISSTVSGRVVSVGVNEGDTVPEGTVLLVIDDAQQRAAVAQAQSQLDAAQARRTQAQMDFDRAQGLGDSISQKALDDARLVLETAQKEVDRLTSLLDQARSLLDEYTVKAPFAGTVLSRGADPGQVVGSSTSLFLFAELSNLHAEASVDELYASEVRRGLVVKARPAGHSTIVDGEVLYVSPRVDASTGGRLVRTSLPDADALGLPVGLTVMLNIIVDKHEAAITIPRQALIEGAEPAVYVIEEGRAVRRPVQYVDWPSDRLITTQGLAPGDNLITDSNAVKAEGALVAAKE